MPLLSLGFSWAHLCVRAQEPGCTATTILMLDIFNMTSRKCTLTVRHLALGVASELRENRVRCRGAERCQLGRINQTDFDENDGTTERLEWIKVSEVNTSEW